MRHEVATTKRSLFPFLSFDFSFRWWIFDGVHRAFNATLWISIEKSRKHIALHTLALCLVPNFRYTCILLSKNAVAFVSHIFILCTVWLSVFPPKRIFFVCMVYVFDFKTSAMRWCTLFGGMEYKWYGAIVEYVYILICSIFGCRLGFLGLRVFFLFVSRKYSEVYKFY